MNIELDEFNASKTSIDIASTSLQPEIDPLPRLPKARDTSPYPRTESARESASVVQPSVVRGDTSTADLGNKRQASNVAKIQLAACFWVKFLGGWNDGTNGPLIPKIQDVYHVGFTIVSLLFVFACIGFLTGAFINLPLSERFGLGKVLIIGSLLQVVAYAIQAPGPPFPVYIGAFTINGIGLSLQDAQVNAYVASLIDRPSLKMGLLHAAYGAGAFTAPLVSTQFAQLRQWSFHYLVSEGFAVLNALLVISVFRGMSHDECLARIGQGAVEIDNSGTSKFSQILRFRAIQLLCVFAVVYVGIEVTIGGWIVTFIREVRGGGPSTGYISSGYFGGLMAGRILLLWVNHKVGEYRVVYLYSLLVLALELIVWLVPSLLGSALSVSIIGFLLGPLYPISMNLARRVLPHWLLSGSLGYVAGFGQAGSALVPFMTGALAGRFGIQSLHPFVVSLIVFMIFLWALIPTKPHSRSD